MRESRRRASKELVRAARGLRQSMTEAEEVLWEALRKQRLDGIPFRRQHPVGAFVLDFYCPTGRLAIEVDGAVHDAQQLRDQARTESLATLGIRVMRLRNDEVLADVPAVLTRIRSEVTAQ